MKHHENLLKLQIRAETTPSARAEPETSEWNRHGQSPVVKNCYPIHLLMK